MEYTITLTQEQISNLSIFLERVSLTGKEVPAYIALIKAIQEAGKKEEKAQQ